MASNGHHSTGLATQLCRAVLGLSVLAHLCTALAWFVAPNTPATGNTFLYMVNFDGTGTSNWNVLLNDANYFGIIPNFDNWNNLYAMLGASAYNGNFRIGTRQANGTYTWTPNVAQQQKIRHIAADTLFLYGVDHTNSNIVRCTLPCSFNQTWTVIPRSAVQGVRNVVRIEVDDTNAYVTYSDYTIGYCRRGCPNGPEFDIPSPPLRSVYSDGMHLYGTGYVPNNLKIIQCLMPCTNVSQWVLYTSLWTNIIWTDNVNVFRTGTSADQRNLDGVYNQIRVYYTPSPVTATSVWTDMVYPAWYPGFPSGFITLAQSVRRAKRIPGGTDLCNYGMHNCGTTSTCVANTTAATFTCTCASGYEPTIANNLKECVDTNECTRNTHTCAAPSMCNNTLGSFTCACPTGYVGSGGSCSDINECTTGAHTCSTSATCTNSAGSFTCACNTGYSGSGTSCTDTNECTAGTHTCSTSATCTNSAGSFTCACNTGYSGSGTTCTDTNECTAGIHTCSTSATCTNSAGSFTCACNTGYSGSGTSCTDTNECTAGTHTCSTSATCTNSAGSFTCACNTGYSGSGTTCTDTNECTAGTHTCSTSATCTNSAGSFLCACNTGYSGSGSTCGDTDECTAGTHTCSTSATCTNTPGSFSCACNTGYTGSGNTCADTNECTAGTHTCSTSATCTNSAGSFTCACNTGYSGSGNTCADTNECTAGIHTCSTSATCTNTAGSFTCICNTGYSGSGNTCAETNECTAGTHTCSTSATCTNTAGSFTCACNTGYTGSGNTCADTNECTAGTHTCSTSATCTNSAGSFTCACNTGYSGSGTTCVANVVATTTTTVTSAEITAAQVATTTSTSTPTPSDRVIPSGFTCFSPDKFFTARLRNSGMQAELANIARPLVAATDPSDSGYCLSVAMGARYIVDCNHPSSNLTLAFNNATGKIRISGTAPRCAHVFSPSQCAEYVSSGNALCAIDFEYSVTASADKLVSGDLDNVGGGTITCPSNAVSFGGKYSRQHAASLLITSATGSKGEHGFGWLMQAKDMAWQGDWLFSLEC